MSELKAELAEARQAACEAHPDGGADPSGLQEANDDLSSQLLEQQLELQTIKCASEADIKAVRAQLEHYKSESSR